MQILSTHSLKILHETKVQADRLNHPKNPELNSDKDEDKDFDSARLNIFLTQKDEKVLIALYTKFKLIFFSFDLDGALWTSKVKKEIPVDLKNNNRAYLDFKEDLIYVRGCVGGCPIIDTQ